MRRVRACGGGQSRFSAHGAASFAALLALVAPGGCAPSSEPDAAPVVAAPAADGAPGVNDPGVSGLVDDNETPFVPVDEAEACALERADTVQFKEPVDIIVVVDNSASMEQELSSMELNINQNFASILEESQLDYRMIVLTLHRRFPRTGYGQSATMLCVTEPLSSVEDCTAAPEPAFSDHFFQYSTRIESDDSFDVLLDTFEPPFDSEDREDEFGNAPLGWSEWLRPGIKKVFLELTDDDEDMASADFVRALSELAPEHFGADPEQPSFVFHSIVGIAPKAEPTEPYQPGEALENGTCTKGSLALPNAGETYQELSRLTGGLRFPICVPAAYDVVFREIAGKVIAQSNLACDFPVPEAPAGRTLDLDRVSVAIEHETTGAATTLLGQARIAAECASDAFFIDGGRIQLCPDVCSAVRGEEGARVDVLFGCESSIIVR